MSARVLLYPEGMVRLGANAGAILSRCDGERTLACVLASPEESFPGVDIEADDKGWIVQG